MEPVTHTRHADTKQQTKGFVLPLLFYVQTTAATAERDSLGGHFLSTHGTEIQRNRRLSVWNAHTT